jgi:hypothetical protein
VKRLARVAVSMTRGVIGWHIYDGVKLMRVHTILFEGMGAGSVIKLGHVPHISNRVPLDPDGD